MKRKYIESEIVLTIKDYILNNIDLKNLSDDNLENLIEKKLNEFLDGEYISVNERVTAVKKIFSSIRGLGVLDTILSDDTITEVMINGKDNVFVEQSGVIHKLEDTFESNKRLEDIIQRIVGLAGREVNQSTPIVDTRLQDGSRVNVVLPPIALSGPTVTIRKFSKDPMTVEKLIKYGSLSEDIAYKLKLLVEAKYNIFICGGTGSGKQRSLMHYQITFRIMKGL